MSTRRSSPFISALGSGAIAGGIALLLTLMGMVETFNERDIITGVMPLGTLLLVSIYLVFGYRTTRAHPGSPLGVRLAASSLTGLIGELFLVGLVVLGQRANLRPVFPNASPELYGLLQFGATGLQAQLAMVVFGAACGALGAGLSLIPPRFRGPLVTGIFAVVLVGLLEDLIHITIGVFPAVVRYTDWMLASGVENGLTPPGAAVLFVVVMLVAFFWPGIRSGSQTRIVALPAGQRHVIALLAYGILAAALLLLPNVLGPYLTDVSNSVMIFVLMALGLNIVVGFAGLLDLGYVAFFAIGAYTMGVLTTTAVGGGSGQIVWGPGFTFWGALPFAVLFSLLAGVLLGIPVLRMRGDYLAIVTLGFGEIIRVVILNIEEIGAARGLTGIPPWANFFWVYFFAGLTILISHRLVTSSVGRAFLAVREDEIAAEAMGVDTTRYKVKAFVIGSALAGVAGALYGSFLMYLNPGMFTFVKSFEVVAMVVLGGLGSITGSILAAIILTILPEGLRYVKDLVPDNAPEILKRDPRMVIYSIMLIVLMRTRPQGLFGRREIWHFLPKRKDTVAQDARDTGDPDDKLDRGAAPPVH
jgi:branched-chain amino acid transport system permease protein